MIAIWRKSSGEYAGQIADSGPIVSAPSADKLFAKFERSGVSSQSVRLVTADGGFTQWSSFADAARAICPDRAT